MTADDRSRYSDVLHQATEAGSVAVFGVFSPEGPPRCSGLPVARYAVDDLASQADQFRTEGPEVKQAFAEGFDTGFSVE